MTASLVGPKLRLRLAAFLVAMPLALTACSSDSETVEDTAATADSTTTSETQSGSMGADAMSEPFGPGCSAVPTSGPGSVEAMATEPVATAASNNPLLSTLVTAVQAAGLVETLNSAQDITVFAPTNDAFAAVPAETMDAALADPQGLLTTVLTHHVVEGQLTPEDLDGEHTTLAGDTITVEGSGEDFTVGEAAVVCGNVKTANATVYVIDQVLLPQA